jgi:sulfate transport system ATP-binding protein
MAIAAHGITKRFGAFTALDDVALDVSDGSLTALLGPSGSGKSTLLRIIAGLEQPDAGLVRIGGADVTRLPPRQRGIGFVFQHYAAFKHMTVRDNVGFGLSIRHRPKAEIRARVAELLRLVQLEGYAERYPSQLSGGQRQRMALARALAVQPNVLLLDEPFGALDATVRRELRDWLRRLHDEMHVTTVLVTHDQDEAMEVADHIVMMNHGRVAQAGSPLDLYERPADTFVMGFLGQVNRLGERYIRPHDIDILTQPSAASVPACVERVIHLGFEVRVALRLTDDQRRGEPLWSQITRAQARDLALRDGQLVHLRLDAARAFGDAENVNLADGPNTTGRDCELELAARALAGRLWRNPASGCDISVSISGGCWPPTTSASVTASSTARRLARTAIQTFCSGVAAPV